MNNKRIVKAAGLSTFVAGLALILGLSADSEEDDAARTLMASAAKSSRRSQSSARSAPC